MASADRGDESAGKALFAALYAELHRMARRELARAGGGGLSATTLLHEAYLDISGRDPAFPDRSRFMAYAARVRASAERPPGRGKPWSAFHGW